MILVFEISLKKAKFQRLESTPQKQKKIPFLDQNPRFRSEKQGKNAEKCTFPQKNRQNIWRFQENVVPLQSQTDKECTTRESATRLAPFKSSRA